MKTIGQKDNSTTNVAGSRNLNLNNYVWNTNWNNGFVAVCEHLHLLHSLQVKALMVRPFKTMVSFLSYESKHITRSVKIGVLKNRNYKTAIEENNLMGKKYKNLFEQIIDIDNIRLAYKKAVAGGNRYGSSHLVFKENLEHKLFLIQEELKNETYIVGEYYQFKVYEPKERLIHALPFKDRVVQHAIHNIVSPIFENVFYPCSFACRKDKGTHKGVKEVQATIRRLAKKGEVFYLKMDFSKYFNSIFGSFLLREISNKIKDLKVLKLLSLFINEVGIHIGNLLSQLFANIYGHIFDRFIKTKLKIKDYFRYMDDTVILLNDKSKLIYIQRVLKRFSSMFLKLKFSKWFINSVESKGLNFLGYRIREKYKLIRKDSVIRAKRKIKKYKLENNEEQLEKFLGSWTGHIKTSDSANLKFYIKKEYGLWKNKQLA